MASNKTYGIKVLHHRTGFTIVELLIVIVVIGILSSITVVAFNGVQGRARDSQRLSDMKTIMKALELYKTTNGSYPAGVQTTGSGGWETSTNGTSPTNFLSALVSPTGISAVPKDPLNRGLVYTGTGQPNDPNSGNSTHSFYFYTLYTAGTSGCDASRGAFYVLGVTRMEGANPSLQSEGFSCPGNSWTGVGSYVVGRFTNG